MSDIFYHMSNSHKCTEVNGEALQVHTVDVFFTTSIVRAHICTTIKLHDTYLVLLVTYAVTLPSSVETIQPFLPKPACVFVYKWTLHMGLVQLDKQPETSVCKDL